MHIIVLIIEKGSFQEQKGRINDVMEKRYWVKAQKRSHSVCNVIRRSPARY